MDSLQGTGTVETEYWLALVRTPGLGSRAIQRLLTQFQTPSALFRHSKSNLEQLGLKQDAIKHLTNTDWSCIEADIRWLEQPGRHLLSIQSPFYPALLREITDPPPVIFVQGDPEVLNLPQLAMVGSRNPSISGHQTAFEFARHLAGTGLTVTSGLAIGIDAASHQGALEGGGVTIAVVGTGLDRVYPAKHHELAHQIAEQGALISEFPPGTPARPGHFPRRNRIISGLSLGTLVVEAALQSGSLITARQAAEQGREVFAIPGSIHNPLARGCHALIRQGAKLVETAGDILEELAPLLSNLSPLKQNADEDTPPTPPGTLKSDYYQLLRNVGFDPVPIDQIIQHSGLTAEAVCSMLLLLELEGYVSSAPGSRYCRTSKAFNPQAAESA